MGKRIARVLGALLALGGVGVLGDSYRRLGSFEFVDSVRNGSRGTPMFILAILAGLVLLAASARGGGETK